MPDYRKIAELGAIIEQIASNVEDEESADREIIFRVDQIVGELGINITYDKRQKEKNKFNFVTVQRKVDRDLRKKGIKPKEIVKLPKYFKGADAIAVYLDEKYQDQFEDLEEYLTQKYPEANRFYVLQNLSYE